MYIVGMSNINCVFVVEEDPGARSGLSRLLRIAGHDVHTFARASELFDAIGTEECGCLVLDLGMPGLSGKELKEELAARGVNQSIIVVTANDNDKTRHEAVKLGAVGFFRKPVDGTALLDAIDWAVRLRSTGSNHEKT